MPIRIQRVAPDTGQVALQPAVRATPEQFGAGIGQAGFAAGVALQRAGLQGLDRLIEIKQAQDEEDAKLDLAQQAGAFKLAVAQREPEIRSQTDAKDYPAAMAQEIDAQAEAAAQRLRYPQLAARFRASLAPTVATEKVQALHAGIKLQNEQIEALAGIQQAEDANAAVFAPTADERAAALERGFTRIQGLVNRGVYSGAQGKAATTTFLGAIERGGAQRDYQNPELRSQVIDNLMSGAYKYIPPEHQIQMATAMVQRQEADQRRLDAAAEKGAKKLYDDAVSDLFAQAANKTLTQSQLDDARVTFRLRREDYAAIRTEMEKPDKKEESDPATLERVVADTHSQYPKLTEKDLLALKQSGALNQKDYQSALDRLRETREGLEAKGRSELHDRHGQAEQNLRAALGIPTMWEKLDPASKKAWNLAMQELTRRSAAYNGKEDPLAVADSMIPRYSKMLDQSATVTADQARAVLKYPTPAALDAARAAGQISAAEYDAQRQLFLAIDKENVQRAGRKLQEDLQKKLGTKKGAATTAPRPD